MVVVVVGPWGGVVVVVGMIKREGAPRKGHSETHTEEKPTKCEHKARKNTFLDIENPTFWLSRIIVVIVSIFT